MECELRYEAIEDLEKRLRVEMASYAALALFGMI